MAGPWDDYKQPQPVTTPASGPWDDYNTNKAVEPVLPVQTYKIGTDPETDKYVEDSKSEAEQMAANLFTPDELREVKANGKIGYWESYRRDLTLPFEGIYKGVKAVKMADYAEKYAAGELSEADKKELLNYARDHAERQIRGYSFMGNVGSVVAQAPAFLAEFALSGGIGKLSLGAATKTATTKAVGKVTETIAMKALKHTAGATALIAMQGPQNYGERRLNDVMTITDKGEALFNEGTEKPATAALKAAASVGIEYGSELSGGLLTKGAAAIGGKVSPFVAPYAAKASELMLDKIPVKVRDALFKAYRAVDNNATVSKIMTAAGWNGMLAELGEERVADVVRTALDLDSVEGYSFDQFMDALNPSAEQWLIEAGAIGHIGMARTAMNGVANRLQKRAVEKGMSPKDAQDMIDNLSQNELEAMFTDMTADEVRGQLQQVKAKAYDLAKAQNIEDDEAEAWSSVMAGNSLWGAKNYGVSPSAYYDRLQLEFGSQTQAADDTMYQGERASIQFMQDGRKIISLLAGSDKSSLLHETGHMFLRELMQAANASDTAKTHLDAVREFVGAKDGDSFTREQEEIFARGFERYFMESVSPSNALRDAFESFREWFIEIYSNVMGLDVPMNNEAREVYDAMLGGKDLDIYLAPIKIENHESSWAKFYRLAVDDLNPIHRAVELAQKMRGAFPDGTNPEFLARLFAAIKGRVQQNLQNQTYYIGIDGNTVVTGEGFKPILEDFDTEFSRIEPDYEQRQRDLQDYLIARRYLSDLEKREDVDVTPKQLEESAQTMAQLAGKYGELMVRMQDYAQRIYDFQARVLENLVHSGLMAQEQYDGILKANPNYIPFQRVFDEAEIEESFFAVGGRGKFVKQSTPVKKIEGSAREVKDPFNQIIVNTARILTAAERNKVSASIANMAAYLPHLVQKVKQPMKKITLDDGTVTYRPDGVPKGLIIEYREKGKRKFVEVSKPLYESLHGMHPVEMNLMGRVFQGVASFFRAAATLPPDFWIRNFIRDVNSASVQSKHGIKPVDVVKGILAIGQKNELYNDWMKSGGSFNSYMELDDKGAERALQEMMRPQGRMMRYVRSAGVEALKDASGAFEQATRIAMFRRAKLKGESDVVAALQSRDGTLDFSRAGKHGRVVNRFVPFLNAAIQGSDRLLRAFKEQPALMTMRAFTTITVPSIVIAGYYLYGAPDDEREEYLEIPQWQKDMFWVYKANGTWWRIPKPFSLGYAFGSLPERFLFWAYEGQKPEAEGLWREFVLGLGGSLSPIQDVGTLMTPVGRIVVESLSNYNFFTGRSIYPNWMDRLPAEERAGKYQSDTALLLGELSGQSPAIIENAMRGMLATTTPYVLSAGDALIRQVKEWNGETLPEKPTTPADMMFVRGFAVRTAEGTRSTSYANFQEKWKEVQQRHASYNKKKGQERQTYMEKHGSLIRAYKPMKNFYDQMGDLQDQIDLIYDNESMSAKQKVEQIGKLDKRITDIARRANSWYIETGDNR
nr:MAG TPA: Type I restriction enzyme Methylase [Caudoviricetes sp.]